MTTNKMIDEYLQRIENINLYLAEDKQLWIVEESDRVNLVVWLPWYHDERTADMDEDENIWVIAVDSKVRERDEIDLFLTGMENIIEWRRNKPFKW